MNDDVFLWGDFGAAEMHSLAQSCKDVVGYSRLGEILNANIDPHAWYGGIAFEGGMSWQDVMKHPKKKTIRNKAKPVNFGLGGGMGPDKWVTFARVQYGQVFTRAEAVHYKNLWFSLLPEVKELQAWVNGLLGGGQFCTVVLPRGGLVAGGKRYCAACNITFQAPTAMGAKQALLMVMIATLTEGSPLYGYTLWNFVHDEICLRGPRDLDRLVPAARELRRIMVQEFTAFCPDYPTDVELSAGTAWSKDAPVFDVDKPRVWEYRQA